MAITLKKLPETWAFLTLSGCISVRKTPKNRNNPELAERLHTLKDHYGSHFVGYGLT